MARIKAGNVSVYDGYMKRVYVRQIKRQPGTFLTHPKMVKINGFTANSLKEGEDPNTVKEELIKLFSGKLVISFGGAVDFMSLGMDAGDFDHFDLEKYYRKPKLDRLGEDLGEAISLRRLCMHFFGEDIQPGRHDFTRLNLLLTTKDKSLRIFKRTVHSGTSTVQACRNWTHNRRR